MLIPTLEIRKSCRDNPGVSGNLDNKRRKRSERFLRYYILKLQNKRCPFTLNRVYLDISVMHHHDLLA